MAETGRKTGFTFWLKGVFGGAILILLPLAAWVCLPDIAASGLQFNFSRERSKKVLLWLGPRAVSQLMKNHTYFEYGPFEDDEWFETMVSICDKAESESAVRRIVARSLESPNLRGKGERTLLHIACLRSCVLLAKTLLENGADVNARNSMDFTPLQTAAIGAHAEIAGLLITHGADVNTKSKGGSTPLLVATYPGNPEFAECLVSYGAKVNCRTKDGWTPLHSAAGSGKIEIVRILVEHGANVNARDREGSTPLHSAAGMGRSESVQFLLDHGADPNAVVGSGRDAGDTPLDRAIACAYPETVELLRKYTREDLLPENRKDKPKPRVEWLGTGGTVGFIETEEEED